MGDPGTSSRQEADCQAGKQAYFERWLVSLERLMDERDRRYEDRFTALDRATEKALVAVREQTAAAFKANETAIGKAEDAQRSYNERSNEFRGQLDDQAKRLMAREEALGKFGVVDEKIEDIKRELSKLRESQMETGGRRVQQQENRATSQWTTGQVLSTLIAVIGFGLAIAAMLLKSKP